MRCDSFRTIMLFCILHTESNNEHTVTHVGMAVKSWPWKVRRDAFVVDPRLQQKSYPTNEIVHSMGVCLNS